MASTFSGTQVFISNTLPSTFDKAGGDALTDFTQVGEVVDVTGDSGRDYTDVTYTLLAEQIEKTEKGSYTPGERTILAMRNDTDPGQQKMLVGRDSNLDQSVKFVYPDGSYDYAFGKIMSGSPNGGGTNDLRQISWRVKLNYDPVYAPAP